jgi:hypothetical protein
MKRNLLVLLLLVSGLFSSYSQPTNIYQPNGTATFFRTSTADSLNYYVNLGYSPFSVMKIDGNNKATFVCDLPASTNQMIFNQGKGIYKTSAGYVLFNGISHTGIVAKILPATYPFNTIVYDYIHIGTGTYFQNQKSIFKTDYSSAENIQALYTSEATNADPTSNAIIAMYNTGKSIFFTETGNPYSGTSPVLKRLDILTGNITTVDNIGLYMGMPMINYNHSLYYATISSGLDPGIVKKVDDNGAITTLLVETNLDKKILSLLGVTPNGVIAYTIKNELVLISSGTSTPLNHNLLSSPLPNVSSQIAKSTNTLVYFQALDSLKTLGPAENSLWVTDGTLAGTKKVISKTDYYSGIAMFNDWQYISSAAACGDDLYFSGQKTMTSPLNLFQINSSNNTYTINTSFSNTQQFYKNPGGGIYMLGSPALAQFAVYKVNCSGVTAVKEILSNQVSFDIFPNPANDQITVSLSGKSKNYSLKIYNLLGETVYIQLLKEQSSSINLNLKSGLYFVNVLDEKGNKSTRKLIIH